MGIEIELVDRSQLEYIQDLKNEYEWLISLSDDQLSQECINTNNVQNALIELLRFVDDVIELPELHFGVDGESFESHIETSDEWLDMN